MSPYMTSPTSTKPDHDLMTTGTAAVIGGGISGLSASVALRRAGWDVSIYERSKFKNEVGAGITVPPSAGLVLRHLGFDFEKARPVANETTRMSRCDAPPGEFYLSETYTRDDGLKNGAVNGNGLWNGNKSLDAERKARESRAFEGFGSCMFHRVDLHRGLRELAEDADGESGRGKKVEMKLGVEVHKVDCEAGILTLADGQTVKVDLVVIADGAHSALLQDFTGSPPEIHRTGRSIYRWLVSMSDVLADPLTAAHYLPTSPTGFISFSDPKKRILWVSYPCRGGTVLNNAVLHDTQRGEGAASEAQSQWHAGASKESVLSQLENFDESRRRIVHLANEDGIKVHHLFKRPALESFVRGRAVVIGDAAHVMLPTHAAGGASAIESAAALEVLFRGVNGSDDELVKDRLRLFDQLRLPRCNLAMLVSNAGGPWTGDPEVEEEVRKFYHGPLPPVGTLPWMKEFREILFHHDAYKTAKQALTGRLWFPN
ncbi:3-hydroxybenzoate 6-hydroxylase [Rhypophila decipiens]